VVAIFASENIQSFPGFSWWSGLKNYKIASTLLQQMFLDKFQTDSNSFQAFEPCAVKM
jgi:hypothetical protein